MTTLEIVLAALSPIGPALGVLGTKVVDARRRARTDAAMVERTDRESDAVETTAREAGAAKVLDRVLDRVGTLETRLDKCEERHTSCERLASGLHERVAVLEGTVGARDEKIADLQAALTKRDADVTQRIEVAAERIARKSPTPPEPIPAQPGPKPALMLREIPPPKRGKETDR